MQQAVISYKDGVERLLIDSTLKGDGTDFAWIVPIPSEPTALDKASPAITAILSQQHWVDITHFQIAEVSIRALVSFLPMLLVVGVAAAFLFFAATRPSFLRNILIILLLAMVLFSIMVPNAGHHGGNSSTAVAVPGVDVEDASTVGNYEVSVLAAINAQALNQWLIANGYEELPGQYGVNIANEYAKEHWHFVAAKLHREGQGLSRPHPLMITFPAKTPVYPMRLTALADSALYLELYIIADGTASVPGMVCDFSDTFSRFLPKEEDSTLAPGSTPAHPDWISRNLPKAEDSTEPVFPEFYGKYSGMIFKMPPLQSLMWPNCTLTKLSATVEPDQMENDFQVTVGASSYVKRHLYSGQGATSVAILVGILAWVLFLLMTGKHSPTKRQCTGKDQAVLSFLWSRLRYIFHVICFLVFVGLAAAGVGTIVYLLLPKTEVHVSWRSDDLYSDFEEAMSALETQGPSLLAGKTEAEVARVVDTTFPKLRRYYDVLKDETGLFVRVYNANPDREAEPTDIRVPQATQPEKAPPPDVNETPK